MADKEPQTFNYQVLKDRDGEAQPNKWQRAIFDWWIALEQHKGERVELRRCQHGEQAMQQLMGYFRLASKLDSLAVSPRAIASVAHLLAFITMDNRVKEKLALQQNESGKQAVLDEYFGELLQVEKGISWLLGQEAGEASGKPIFSTLRFQRLLQSAAEIEHNDFDVSFRRAIRQLQGKNETEHVINPIITAEQIFYRYRANKSPDKYQGSRKFEYQFARDYYQEVLRYHKESQGVIS